MRRRKRYGNILDQIGRTPLVPIRRVKTNPKVQIYGKIEAVNPGGSIKDRIALSMIEAAEASGELTHQKTVIEASSGNTGIGLALVSAVKGYRCLIAMSESASLERRKIMRAFGADLLLTPAERGTDGAIEAVYELARREPERYYLTDQYNNPANWQAHYYGTAPEIWKETKGKVTHVIAGMGTTGTLMGIARYFREHAPEVQVIGVEPYPGHRLQGLKNLKESYPPGIFDKKLPHRILNIHDEEALELTRRLAKEEGIFVGMSSGAALAGALEIAKELEEGLIVVIFPDGGERYLSTPLWTFEDKEDHRLRFTNTLTRRKEPFKPLKKEQVGIYTCGPTVHRRPHLGLYRRMVTADLLRRFLEYKGFQVIHVVNITDYDDKTIQAAEEAGLSLKELTDHYTQIFFEDLKILGVKPATHFPRASEHIKEMVTVTRKLLEKGYAYVKHGSVYFDVSKLSDYGALAKIDLAKLKAGATVDLDEYEKDSPVDFTLFKRTTLYELKKGLFVETEWGKVRPGWHVQCAAMAMKYLGETFDIHTSGTDLIFPHHEDEMAIAKAVNGKPLARYWLHSALVLVDGKKMSHTAGNAVTIDELLEKGFSGREIRYFLLRTHYRKPLSFSWKDLEAAKKSLQNIEIFVALLAREPSTSKEAGVIPVAEKTFAAFEEALEDDLNVSPALAAIFDLVRQVYPILAKQGLSKKETDRLQEILEKIDAVLGIIPQVELVEEEEILELLRKREEARAAGDFEVADHLREEIQRRGLKVIDTPRGSVVYRLRDV